MSRTRTLDKQAESWNNYTARVSLRVPSSEVMNAHIEAFESALQEYTLPDNKGHLQPQHMLTAFYTALREKQAAPSSPLYPKSPYLTFLQSLAENRLPDADKLPSASHTIQLKNGEITLSPEDMTKIHGLMEPFVRSYAADLLIQQEHNASISHNKAANQYLEGAWEAFKEQISADATLQNHVNTVEAFSKQYNLRNQDAFKITAEIINEIKDTKLSYHSFLKNSATTPYSGVSAEDIKAHFPKGISTKNKNGEEITIPPEKLGNLYVAAKSLAQPYEQKRLVPLSEKLETDITLAEEMEAVERANQNEGVSPPSPEANPAQSKKPTQPQPAEKRRGLSFAGKVTVAAAAVGIVTAILAMLLGGKSKQPAPAR